MDLVERVKAILLQPKSEWQAIASEPGDFGTLFSNYVAYVAAIPPVCTFIGGSIFGLGGIRLGIFVGLIHAVIMYVLALVIYLVARAVRARQGIDLSLINKEIPVE